MSAKLSYRDDNYFWRDKKGNILLALPPYKTEKAGSEGPAHHGIIIDAINEIYY